MAVVIFSLPPLLIQQRQVFFIVFFNYSGLDTGPGTDNNLGSSIRHSYDLPGSHTWLAGCDPF